MIKSRFYRQLLYKTVFFFLVWLVLSESFDQPHMGLGLASALGVAWFNTDRGSSRSASQRLRIIGYIPWLMVQVVKSGIHLSVIILNPALPISPKLFRYRTSLREDAGIVLLANSITLTPGTITLEVNEDELVVHAIDDSAVADVTNQQFEKRILRLMRKEDGQ